MLQVIEPEVVIVSRIDATRGSDTPDQAFSELLNANNSHGLPREWRKLHQGGVVGYKLEKHFASHDRSVPIQDGSAFAWNISIQGTKPEDTYLLQDRMMHLVTRQIGSTWPILEQEVGGVVSRRPGIRGLGQ